MVTRRQRGPDLGSQTFEMPNDAEAAWLERNVARARYLLVETECGNAESTISVDLLDCAFERSVAAWSGYPANSRSDPNVIVNAIGIAFGQCCVDGLGFQWSVVSDDGGTEMAVTRRTGSIVVYPTSVVAKRFEQRAFGELAPLYDGIARQVALLKR